jgi:hypothetical protein
MSGQTQGCIQDHQNNVIIGPRVWTGTRLYTGSPEQRNYNLVSVQTCGPILTLFWWPCIQPCICRDMWTYNYVVRQVQGCIQGHQNNVIIGPHVWSDTRLNTGSPEQRNYRSTCLNRYKVVYGITRTRWAYNYVALVTPYTTLYLFRHVGL